MTFYILPIYLCFSRLIQFRERAQMNRLAFDSSKEKIDEWKEVYFCETIIDSFETLIDRTHMYLEIINNHKMKMIGGGKAKRLKSKKSLCQSLQQDNQQGISSQVKYFEHENPDVPVKRIETWIKDINELQNKVKAQWRQLLKKVNNNSKKVGDVNVTQQVFDTLEDRPIDNTQMQICSSHLQKITVQSFKFYNAFLHQQFIIIKAFLKMKFQEVLEKYQNLQSFFEIIKVKDQDFPKLRIIYDNLFIQIEYLNKFVRKNKVIFEAHSHQKEYSSGYQQINEIRERFITQLQQFCQKIDQTKQKMRVLYMTYIKRSTKKIRNHQKLEKKILTEIEADSMEKQKDSSAIYFVNGFTIAFLLCALIAIIIFRQVNINQLESDANYLRDFKIWRGASYLICFNWVIGIAFWVCRWMKVNYRMILTEDDSCLPGPQSFFLSASLLSALYLALFLVYLLHQLEVIGGHSSIAKLGYAAWVINIIFLLCPLRILNYEGRRYFLILFGKFLASLIRPMNMNIFFVAIVVGSFVQPFSDFAFTLCQVVYREERECIKETGDATLGFTVGFLFYRCVQSIRSHIQFGDRCYSRPLIGITAVLFSLNTVISAFLYGLYLTDGLLTYWLVSAALSTLAGIQADLRADWGLISFDREDCILRKYKTLPRGVYFMVAVVDIVLNIGWVLTISNNTASGLGIDMVYFLMILSYVELARKAMWIVFRLQDDHSLNIAYLKATLDDSHIYQEIGKFLDPKFQELIVKNPDNKEQLSSVDQKEIVPPMNNKIDSSTGNISSTSSNGLNKNFILSDIQCMVQNKKLIRTSLEQVIKKLESYLKVVHSIYQNLDWDEQY